MTVDQRRRLQLYEIARERFGAEAADTLMELLPPMDPSDLASKQDLGVLRAEMREEFAEFRGELRHEFAEFRGELRTEMHDLFREQTNRLVMFTVPTVLSGIALAFAAARF
jgi:hypothetical protein